MNDFKAYIFDGDKLAATYVVTPSAGYEKIVAKIDGAIRGTMEHSGMAVYFDEPVSHVETNGSSQ